VLAILALVSGTASAEPTLRLDVRGDCDLDGAWASVREMLGRDPVDTSSATIVHVHTHAHADRATGELSIETAAGQAFGPRRVEAKDCPRLATSLAVVLATAVMSLPDPPPQSASAAPQPTSAVVPDAQRAPVPVHSPLEFDAIAGIADGTGDSIARVTSLVAVRAQRGAFAVEVGSEIAVPSDVAVADGASVHLSTVIFAARPCARLGPVTACVLAAAGWATGSATGVTKPHSVTLPIIGTGAGGAYEHALTSRFALRIRAEARVNVVDARFEVSKMPVVSTPRVEGWLGLDAIARIP
jgi:hypothetical protein